MLLLDVIVLCDYPCIMANPVLVSMHCASTYIVDFSLGLYNRIRGSYLDHGQCRVEWNSEDGVPVGGSTVISVQVSGCGVYVLR